MDPLTSVVAVFHMAPFSVSAEMLTKWANAWAG